MSTLSREHRSSFFSTLVERRSIRATVKMTGVSKNRVTKLLIDREVVCSQHRNHIFLNLHWKPLQVDEVWPFCTVDQINILKE